MNTLKFNKVAAQGELTITKLDKPPKKLGDVVKAENGLLIVGHSETHHHHVVDADCATLTRVDSFTAFLAVRKATLLVHQRDYDTHPAIELQPGMYEFRTGREFDRRRLDYCREAADPYWTRVDEAYERARDARMEGWL